MTIFNTLSSCDHCAYQVMLVLGGLLIYFHPCKINSKKIFFVRLISSIGMMPALSLFLTDIISVDVGMSCCFIFTTEMLSPSISTHSCEESTMPACWTELCCNPVCRGRGQTFATVHMQCNRRLKGTNKINMKRNYRVKIRARLLLTMMTVGGRREEDALCFIFQ